LLREADPSIPECTVSKDDFDMTSAYFGDGYGVPTAAGKTAAEWLLKTHGYELEPTYTAKTFAAVLDAVRRRDDPGPVLYWHTFAGPVFRSEARSVPTESVPEPFRRYLS
jgi:1-aminocyclopropane-1-carboxylate deaminase/D-cysteine desulfhydrase-like pyridoxal-dependent ACC family enzyme